MKDKEKQIEICENCKNKDNCNHRELVHKDGCRVNDCDYFQSISIDAEKQIEEMASDMDYGCVKHDLWPEDAKEIAKALTILGYQKISENKVVFDRDDWQRWVYDIAEQSEKEMARKFYDKFNENICYFKLENKSEDYKDGYVQAIADICGKLDQTAIELGVDLKEYYGK